MLAMKRQNHTDRLERPRGYEGCGAQVEAARGKYLLVVHAEEALRKCLARRGQSFDVDVRTGDSVETALWELKGDWHPDVVLAGYRLNGKDTGRDLLEELHARYPRSRLYFISGNPDSLTADQRTIYEPKAGGFKRTEPVLVPVLLTNDAAERLPFLVAGGKTSNKQERKTP